MSTPKTTPWKTIAIGFIILTVAFGAIAGAAVSQMTSLSNDKTNLQNQYNALKTLDTQNNQTIRALNAKVSSLQTQLQANYTEVQTLNGQIATDNALITHLQAELQANYTQVQTLTAQISNLQNKITALQGEIVTLNNQIASLNAQIVSLQTQIAAPNIGACPSVSCSTDTAFSNPFLCFFSICYHNGIGAIAWADAGTIGVSNVFLTYSFYDASNVLVCRFTITEGATPGLSVQLDTSSHDCGDSTTRATTFSLAITWS